MGEVVEWSPIHQSSAITNKSSQPLQVLTITRATTMEDQVTAISATSIMQPQDAWLPITQSRNGSVYSSTIHLLCSGIGIQALLLPLAFTALGWISGILCLSLAFTWQLYTIWLLVHLHESVCGSRYSRYLHLSIASFGEKIGKLLAIFPVMYLSGGTCVMLIITGGGTLELFFKTLWGDASNPLTGAGWFLVFTCSAIVVAQLPNLNSIVWVSLVGTITAVGYCSIIWVLSIYKGRPLGVSYDRPSSTDSDVARICGIMNAIGIVALAFRGHNVVLEIQGTIPSSPKHPSHKPMWIGVTTSYVVIAMCLFPLGIGGYWAYGNKMPANGGMLSAFTQFHGHNTSKLVLGIIYILVVLNSLCSFQIYAMIVFDNLEAIYTRKKNKPCPAWLRPGFRVFFGGIAFLVAVAFPFLGSLAALIGGMTLPLTFGYPCFMWIAIKKPPKYGAIWWLNMGLGCLAIVLSLMLVSAALWKLVTMGLNANFFNPH